jgi:3-isopropylmalate/(R)-2-methylmalate dehydratase small subunit
MSQSMRPYKIESGLVAPLARANVDTDQIIPKQFLKRIERTGFGECLFYDWRYKQDGTLDESFILNSARYQGASILVVGQNFGCGSSREHAPWALEDYGFRTIIAPSFADIFYNNCFKNGMLPIVLPEDKVEELLKRASEIDAYRLTVDLENRELFDDSGFKITFEVDEFRRYCLMEGLDDIGLTLKHKENIIEYEKHRPEWLNLHTQ